MEEMGGAESGQERDPDSSSRKMTATMANSELDPGSNDQSDPQIHVLLVEDDLDDINIAKWLAAKSQLPINLTVTTDSQDALDYLFRRGRYVQASGASRPDLVLLDIGLPGTNGIEVLRQLKADQKLREILVIMWTGSENDRHIRVCEELGAHSHIVKPMKLRDFVWIVRSLRNCQSRLAKLPGPTA